MTEKNRKNENFSVVKQNVLTKIDVKAGDFTLGQRIELGELFSSNKSDLEKIKETFKILHEITPDMSNQADINMFASYYIEIIEGLQFWIEKEMLLKYNPDPEEIRAGIKELSSKIGYYGTIKALAKNYGQDPDDILKWKYGKVFGILYTDLEEFKYSKRLHKQYERKIKR